MILQSRDTARFTKHEYLLKGFLKCHHCGRNLQIALKGSGGNPYINCIGHEKRGKHPISMNYWKFEENILQVIKNICNMYLDEKVFFEAYKKYKNGYGDLIKKYEKDLQQVETRIEYINSNIDKMYFDKLNGIIGIDDYMRYRQQFSEEKVNLIDKQYDIKQKIETIKEKENQNINEQEINKIVKDFLQMKKVDKMLLYRILNYIEIDTNKNIYIHFNMNQLNIIGDSMEVTDKWIEYKQILKR